MRIIGHLDMDAFFAAVEERDNPYFKGLPLVVGADPKKGGGRGVVSTANYKAREYSIHSAMPISLAWQLSQEAKKQGKKEVIFLEPDFEKYEKASEEILKILRKYSSLIEPASIDEFYFDLSFAKTFSKAKKICQKLKEEIKKKEKLTCSIGIGPNKLIAKIASGQQKPDGLVVITKGKGEKFLEPLPIGEIPGIGPKTEEFFHQQGIKKVKDLKKFSRKELREMLGKWGEDLYEKVRGRDESPLVEEYEVKSIGEQETFLKDTGDANFILERFKTLCESVFGRFQKSEFKTFRTITVTVRFADFETKSRSHTLPKPTKDKKVLELEGLKLLLPFLDRRKNPKRKLIRLVGLRVEKLA